MHLAKILPNTKLQHGKAVELRLEDWWSWWQTLCRRVKCLIFENMYEWARYTLHCPDSQESLSRVKSAGACWAFLKGMGALAAQAYYNGSQVLEVCRYAGMINEHSESTELCTCNGCHSKRLWPKSPPLTTTKDEKYEGFPYYNLRKVGGTTCCSSPKRILNNGTKWIFQRQRFSKRMLSFSPAVLGWVCSCVSPKQI